MDIDYEIDTNLVRGLDYYNHTVFEIIGNIPEFGNANVLGGGGRYNGLVKELDGPEVPAVGFAMGLDRTILAMRSREKYINKELRQFDYKAGDTLKCEYSTDSGQSDDKDMDISQLTESVDITLAEVTDVRPLGYEKSYDTPLIVMNKDSFDGLWKDRACDYSYNINQNAYIITSDADKYQDELEKELDDMTSESGFSYYIENQDRNMKQEKSLFTLVGIFAYGFIVVIALIGITNIINTLGTSMELRSREFATLRSIGMTDKQFYKMVRLESLFISVKSLVIGVPAGLVITYIINVMENRMDTVVVYVLPVKAVIMCAIVVIVLIYAIMNLSMSKIRHQNVIETIKNENL